MTDLDYIQKYLPENVEIEIAKGDHPIFDHFMIHLRGQDKEVINTVSLRTEDVELLKPKSAYTQPADLQKEIKDRVNGKEINPYTAQRYLGNVSEYLDRMREERHFNTHVAPLAQKWLSLEHNLDTSVNMHITFDDEFATFNPKIARYAHDLLNIARCKGELPLIEAKKLDERWGLGKFIPNKEAKLKNQENAEKLAIHLTKMLEIEKTLEKEMSDFPKINSWKDKGKGITEINHEPSKKHDDSMKEFMTSHKEKACYLGKFKDTEEALRTSLTCARYLGSIDKALPKARLATKLDAHRLAMQNVDENGHKVSISDKMGEKIKDAPSLNRIPTTDIYGRGSDKENSAISQKKEFSKQETIKRLSAKYGR